MNSQGHSKQTQAISRSPKYYQSKMVDKKKTTKPTGEKRRKHADHSSYGTDIFKVIKQAPSPPQTGMRRKAMSIMNSFVNDSFEKIATEAGKLVLLQD